jgi:formyltetrahydrofolate hydrolase
VGCPRKNGQSLVSDRYPAKPVNHADAKPLAAAFGLPFHHVGVGEGANARAEQEAQLAELTRQGRDLETVVLARAVRAHVEHRVLTFGNRTVVFS